MFRKNFFFCFSFDSENGKIWMHYGLYDFWSLDAFQFPHSPKLNSRLDSTKFTSTFSLATINFCLSLFFILRASAHIFSYLIFGWCRTICFNFNGKQRLRTDKIHRWQKELFVFVAIVRRWNAVTNTKKNQLDNETFNVCLFFSFFRVFAITLWRKKNNIRYAYTFLRLFSIMYCKLAWNDKSWSPFCFCWKFVESNFLFAVK